MVKIYADGADLATMASLKCDGYTTNPSLMKKAGISDYRTFAREVLAIAEGKPVSFEVFADDFDGMERQAREIASWGGNVYVKIPVTNTLGEFTGPVIERLEGVQLNVTAILTAKQIHDVRGALGNAPAIVSVFAGRIADTGVDPVKVIREGWGTPRGRTHKILWASAREVYNVVQAEQCCDIITLTPDLIAKLALFGKDLTRYSLETVQQFHNDAKGIAL